MDKVIVDTNVFISRDPEDNFLLELAEEAGADYLVSGDKDLLTLNNFKKTKIVTPAGFLKILNKT